MEFFQVEVLGVGGDQEVLELAQKFPGQEGLFPKQKIAGNEVLFLHVLVQQKEPQALRILPRL
jgi:hypothetical protein